MDDSSFSSLDNVSVSSLRRQSSLRHQREVALRRRQNQLPVKNDSFSSDGGRSASHRSNKSNTTSAMADVLAWEEAKTKERIETRMKEEEVRRVEEARMRAAMARAAEQEQLELRRKQAEAARRAELVQEQLELKRKLAEERRSREEAALRVEVEARRLAEAKADAERLEKQRLVAEAATRAELEKRLAAAERAKAEAEQLAERARMMERQSMERQFSAPLRGMNVNRSVDQGLSASFQRVTCPPSNSGCSDSNKMGMMSLQQVPPSQMVDQMGEEAYGHFQEVAGSNNGYQRYLSTFHQAGEDAATVISELTDVNSPHESTAVLQAEKSLNLRTSNNAELRGSKIQRSVSTRSLSFNEVNEADQSTRNRDTEDAKATSKQAACEDNTLPKEGANPLSTRTPSLQQITFIENVNLDDPKVMRSFMMKPCPKEGGMIQCCIRRNKGIKNALFPEYRLYLKSNNSKTETFLMTSKKRVGNKTSNYLISMSRNDHDKNSDGILGKLRSNFLGTEYMIYDHGKNPGFDDSYYDEKNEGDTRCELGAILYAASTSLGSKGPRKMKVCIGKVDGDGNPSKVWQPTNKNDERMATCMKKETSNIDELVCLDNKPPEWNEAVGAYVLNFNGRVTMASVKNFQLCAQNEEQEQIMQFGRVGKEEFTLDVQWPMSLYQAFAIALSSFDSKLGCD